MAAGGFASELIELISGEASCLLRDWRAGDAVRTKKTVYLAIGQNHQQIYNRFVVGTKINT